MKKNNEITNFDKDREIIKNDPVLDVDGIRKSLNIGRDSAYKILNDVNLKSFFVGSKCKRVRQSELIFYLENYRRAI